MKASKSQNNLLIFNTEIGVYARETWKNIQVFFLAFESKKPSTLINVKVDAPSKHEQFVITKMEFDFKKSFRFTKFNLFVKVRWDQNVNLVLSEGTNSEVSK